jgi:hypothetical protein
VGGMPPKFPSNRELTSKILGALSKTVLFQPDNGK